MSWSKALSLTVQPEPFDKLRTGLSKARVPRPARATPDTRPTGLMRPRPRPGGRGSAAMLGRPARRRTRCAGCRPLRSDTGRRVRGRGAPDRRAAGRPALLAAPEIARRGGCRGCRGGVGAAAREGPRQAQAEQVGWLSRTVRERAEPSPFALSSSKGCVTGRAARLPAPAPAPAGDLGAPRSAGRGSARVSAHRDLTRGDCPSAVSAANEAS